MSTIEEKKRLEKLQEYMFDLESCADAIGQSINCAENCENLIDFFDNIAQALEDTELIVKELKKILKKNNKSKK